MAPIEECRRRSRLWGGSFLHSLLSATRATDDRPYKHKVLRTERRPRHPFFRTIPQCTTNLRRGDHWSPYSSHFKGEPATQLTVGWLYHHSVTSQHLSSRRGFRMAPIEGSWRRSRLWGGSFLFSLLSATLATDDRPYER